MSEGIPDDISFQERRGYLQRRCNVVEAVGVVVYRQKIVAIKLQREQITDRIGIFGAVQTMKVYTPQSSKSHDIASGVTTGTPVSVA